MGEDRDAAATGTRWFLEGFDPGTHRHWRVPVATSPFRIGRRPGSEMQIVSPPVSLEHAELRATPDGLELCDLGSTNGTFVNGRRIVGTVALAENDIVRFADSEFRLGALSEAGVPGGLHSQTTPIARPTAGFLESTARLRELLATGAATALFQPIVELPGGRVIGHEALGRGALPGFLSSPADLFDLAAAVGLGARLSALFRERALASAPLAEGELLFLNSHASELGDSRLLRDLDLLRERRPELRLVLEVSEHFGATPAALRQLRRELAEIGVMVAYDDFGAGLARLNELAEAPPDFLKVDGSLIRGLAGDSASKRALVGALVGAAGELGMRTVAEGVETREEAGACAELGFTHAQGFHFGHPVARPAALLPTEERPR
ncbi:MAG: EAL domain-containing protein [Thermoanaerobaculia bacterium]|nr:EAL domain-containing protein [Thermoanaerobaculia bacterium]